MRVIEIPDPRHSRQIQNKLINVKTIVNQKRKKKPGRLFFSPMTRLAVVITKTSIHFFINIFTQFFLENGQSGQEYLSFFYCWHQAFIFI
ncbi:MAG: hypothetical protein KKE64_04895, partial [Candidatus Omnitrophica bacterium]|nr:hypothetical protein [Candidatus Omnitrophota bacterium]